MNEDFLLPRTPGKARLLMRLAANNESMTLSHEVLALASEGALTEESFAALSLKMCAVRRAALQLMLDLDLRCVIPAVHPAYSRSLVLNAAKVAGAEPIIVFSPTPQLWLDAAGSSGTEMLTPSVEQVIDSAWQKDKRDGVIIVEYGANPAVADIRQLLSAIGREWHRTIIYGDPDYDPLRSQMRLPKPVYKAKHWSESAGLTTMISAVYPAMAQLWPSRRSNLDAKAFVSRGFKNVHPSSIAFLFGLVVPSD